MVNGALDQPYSGRFAGNEHRFALRADFSGVVYHASYLRFMERARSDMLRLAGIDQRGALERGEGVYMVVDLAIRYRRPARLDDELIVLSRVNEIRAASCIIHQRVMRDSEVLTEAEVIAAFISPDGRPRRQPPAWIEIFGRIKGES